MMFNKGTSCNLPDDHTLDIGILCPYVQIYNAQQSDFYNLLDIDTLGIGIYGPYERISDEWQGYLSELPYNHTHTSGPYVQIADV
jgi:hypothetical protein